MKRIRRIFVFLLFAVIAVLFYSNRANFISKYDAVYWKDRYEHSQWRLPLSPRTLGDNGLYAYEGYEIVHGGNPVDYNAEIPPLGKYAIGAVITRFGSVGWYGALTGLTVLLLLFLVSKKVLKNTTYALIVATWFAVDPLFVSQWPATMLDSLHTACLLLFFLIMFDVDKESRWRIIAGGITLGIFSAVKYPVLSVILGITSCLYIRQKTKSFGNIFLFLGSTLVVYTLSFIRYFMLGHTIVQWIGVQKWMFSFYFRSRLEANIGSIWTTLLVNRYQNLFTKVWQSASEWTPVWSVITVTGAVLCFRMLRNVKKGIRYFQFIALSVLGISVFYSFTTFWTRYLTLILPFLYIGTAWALKTIKRKWVIFGIIFGIFLINGMASRKILFPAPEADIKQFIYDWEHGFFQDMYERFTVDAKANVDRYTFHRSMQQILRDGEIEDIRITPVTSGWSRKSRAQSITLSVTYSTRALGKFQEITTIPVTHENGLWRISWEPQYFMHDLTEKSKLKTTVVEGRRGSLIGRKTGPVAYDFSSYMILITPENVDAKREYAMLKTLQNIFGSPALSTDKLYHRYSVNTQPDWPIPIGIIPAILDEEQKNNLMEFTGLTMTSATGRYEAISETEDTGRVENTHYTECCSLLYSTTTYDGVSGLEQLYNAGLKGENGGTLEIIDNGGNTIRTLIEKDRKNGEDVLF